LRGKEEPQESIRMSVWTYQVPPAWRTRLPDRRYGQLAPLGRGVKPPGRIRSYLLQGRPTAGGSYSAYHVTITMAGNRPLPGEGIEMRVEILRFLAVALVVVFALAGSACGHGTYMTQRPAPEQGSGGAGGY
jgi:hypothetical protein